MSSNGQLRPLHGDGCGRYRIWITGNSGAGKTTLGRELGELLDITVLSLDTLAFLPGWRKASADELREKVVAAMSSNDKGWVIDGNYIRILGSIVQDNATDIIWLDPPLLLYFPRLCWRTVLRLFRLAPPCSPGCEEDWREVFFSKKSIVWWCLSMHWVVRKREAENYKTDGTHVGGKRRRIGGWGSELEAWKQSVRELGDSE